MRNLRSRGAKTKSQFVDKSVAYAFCGAVILFIFCVAYNGYGEKYFGFFSTMYYEFVAVLVSIVALALYLFAAGMLQDTSYANYQKQWVQHIFAISLLIPIVILTIICLLWYKGLTINNKIAAEHEMKLQYASAHDASDNIISECKYAKMKVYMARGYSLFKAEDAAYSDCAANGVASAAKQLAATTADSVRRLSHSSRMVGSGPSAALLRSATGSEWMSASDADRLATSAYFIYAVSHGTGTPDTSASAAELNACITNAVSGAPQAVASVSDVAAACLVLLSHQ